MDGLVRATLSRVIDENACSLQNVQLRDLAHEQDVFLLFEMAFIDHLLELGVCVVAGRHQELEAVRLGLLEHVEGVDDVKKRLNVVVKERSKGDVDKFAFLFGHNFFLDSQVNKRNGI